MSASSSIQPRAGHVRKLPADGILDLSFLDFVTFNVYLHDREVFRRYLFRLRSGWRKALGPRRDRHGHDSLR
jgi:hypothetical protein